MIDVFLKIFNISITVSYIALAVMLVRLLLKKAPKWINCVLWALVGVRLLMPFSIESVLSLIPSTETVPEHIVMSPSPSIDSGIPVVNEMVNPVISEAFTPKPSASVNSMEIILTVASVLWIVGIFAMVVYGVVSFLRVKKRVAPSIRLRGNVYFCDDIDTPFILGVVRPRIYLPSEISERDMKYVIDHEKAHLKRGDHIWKPLGFLLLAVYWFNPLLWVAYALLCRDIEKACDERVVKDMEVSDKKGYSEALIGCSVHRRMITACPLAFGEVNVKGRIKNVLSYKKPAFWIIIIALASCIAVGVFFLTDPISKGKKGDYSPPITVQYYLKDGTSVVVNDYSSEVLFDIINQKGWVDDGRSVDGDFIIEINGKTLVYNTANGVFGNDKEKLSLELNEIDRLSVNRLLWGLVDMDGERLNELRYTVPEYFGIDTSNGLYVFVGEMARGSYGCKLTGGDIKAAQKELWTIGSVSIEDMKLILSTYDIDADNISVEHYQPMHSSYMCMYPDVCKERVREMLFVSNDEIAAKKAKIGRLRERYPVYFNFMTMMGIKVYIEEVSPGDYKCRAMSVNDQDKTKEEVSALPAASIEDMRLILSTYNIPDNKIVFVRYDSSKSEPECFVSAGQDLHDVFFGK